MNFFSTFVYATVGRYAQARIIDS